MIVAFRTVQYLHNHKILFMYPKNHPFFPPLHIKSNFRNDNNSDHFQGKKHQRLILHKSMKLNFLCRKYIMKIQNIKFPRRSRDFLKVVIVYI